MRFEKLDLNLLVALVSLVETQSVSDTAEALNLSQPTISAALKRLRDYFDDNLLVQTGRVMVPTPKGREVAEAATEVLNLTRFKIIQSGVFDPLQSNRRFQIIASDYGFEIVLSKLIAKLATTAKHLRFDILPIGPQTVKQFEKGDIDLLVTVDSSIVPGFPEIELYLDDDVLMCWEHSHWVKDGVSAKDFITAGFAIATFGEDRRRSISEVHFQNIKLERNVTVEVSSFSLLPSAIIGSDRLSVVHRRQAEVFQKVYPIVILPLPVESAQIRQVVQWHKLREKDSGLKWLIEQLCKEAALIN